LHPSVYFETRHFLVEN